MLRALTLLALVSPVLAPSEAEALSCDNRIVAPGDSLGEVASLCGEPTTQVERDEIRTRTVRTCGADGQTRSRTVSWSVHVSTWVYDRGPHRLMQELTFENGALVGVRSLGHGRRTDRLEPGAAAPRRFVIVRRD